MWFSTLQADEQVAQDQRSTRSKDTEYKRCEIQLAMRRTLKEELTRLYCPNGMLKRAENCTLMKSKKDRFELHEKMCLLYTLDTMSTCPICQTDFSEACTKDFVDENPANALEPRLLVTTCGHIFHSECLQQYVLTRHAFFTRKLCCNLQEHYHHREDEQNGVLDSDNEEPEKTLNIAMASTMRCPCCNAEFCPVHLYSCTAESHMNNLAILRKLRPNKKRKRRSPRNVS